MSTEKPRHEEVKHAFLAPAKSADEKHKALSCSFSKAKSMNLILHIETKTVICAMRQCFEKIRRIESSQTDF
jgi:hypothetical protein